MSELSKFGVILNKEDRYGDKIKFDLNTGLVTLTKREGKKLNIGNIELVKGKLVYTKKENEDHIYRKTKSWTINKIIADEVDQVRYITNLAEYDISKENISMFGHYVPWEKAMTVDQKVYAPIQFWNVKHKNTFDQAIIDRIGWEWYSEVGDEFRKPYMIKLARFIKKREKEGIEVYPKVEDRFKAFELCPLMETKVVIIGQDPYHTPGAANGLAFSINPGFMKVPPSLRNILQEVTDDYGTYNYEEPRTDLTRWAKQGVLLLNTSLTVEKGAAGSHSGKGWERFIQVCLDKLAKNSDILAFILWGNHAKQYIDSSQVVENALVITSPHPSPFSASKGFFKSKPFTKVNKFLEKNGIEKIHW